MWATEGHVLHLRSRYGADPDGLESVRRRLVALLGAWLVDSAVLDDETVRLHVATASPITALASVSAAVRALGCEDLFVAAGALAAHDTLDVDDAHPGASAHHGAKEEPPDAHHHAKAG